MGQAGPLTGQRRRPQLTPRRLERRPLAKPPPRRHIRVMVHRVAKTFGSRAEPRAVTGEASGMPLSATAASRFSANRPSP